MFRLRKKHCLYCTHISIAPCFRLLPFTAQSVVGLRVGSCYRISELSRVVTRSASFLTETLVRSPQFFFIIEKKIFSGSKHPENILFNFEYRCTGNTGVIIFVSSELFDCLYFTRTRDCISHKLLTLAKLCPKQLLHLKSD